MRNPRSRGALAILSSFVLLALLINGLAPVELKPSGRSDDPLLREFAPSTSVGYGNSKWLGIHILGYMPWKPSPWPLQGLKAEVTKLQEQSDQAKEKPITLEGYTNYRGFTWFRLASGNYRITTEYEKLKAELVVTIQPEMRGLRVEISFHKAYVSPEALYLHDDDGDGAIDPWETMEALYSNSELPTPQGAQLMLFHPIRRAVWLNIHSFANDRSMLFLQASPSVPIKISELTDHTIVRLAIQWYRSEVQPFF